LDAESSEREDVDDCERKTRRRGKRRRGSARIPSLKYGGVCKSISTRVNPEIQGDMKERSPNRRPNRPIADNVQSIVVIVGAIRLAAIWLTGR
jgi:hypothetical protein